VQPLASEPEIDRFRPTSAPPERTLLLAHQPAQEAVLFLQGLEVAVLPVNLVGVREVCVFGIVCNGGGA